MPEYIEEILVDMDGVITDFVESACRAHKKNLEYVLQNWPDGETATHKALGISSEAEMFKVLDAQGENHWEKMQKYPWADYLWIHCRQIAKAFVCTSPSRNASSSYGKVKWLQAWLGEDFRNYVITPHKYLMARPTRLLIDDWDANCEAFRKAGGHAIVFPRLWNSNREHANDPIKYFITAIMDMTDDGLFKVSRTFGNTR